MSTPAVNNNPAPPKMTDKQAANKIASDWAARPLVELAQKALKNATSLNPKKE